MRQECKGLGFKKSHCLPAGTSVLREEVPPGGWSGAQVDQPQTWARHGCCLQALPNRVTIKTDHFWWVVSKLIRRLCCRQAVRWTICVLAATG